MVPATTLARATDALAAVRDDERAVFVFPVLLQPDVIDALEAQDALEPQLHALLPQIRATIEALDEPGFRYPIGIGPVERTWMEVVEGQRTREAAVRHMAHLSITEGIVPQWTQAIVSFLWGRKPEFSEVDEDHVEQQLVLVDLVIAALDAAPDDDRWRSDRIQLAKLLVAYTHLFLVHIPDGRRLDMAVVETERWLATDLSDDDRGDLLFRLGVTHLDPYSWGWIPSHLAGAMTTWHERGRMFHAGLDLERWRMPKPPAALAESARLLRLACEVEATGRRLKALCQALYWWREVDEDAPDLDGELTARAQEALAAIDSAVDLKSWLFIRNLFTDLGLPPPAIGPLPEPGDLVESIGPAGAVEVILNELSFLAQQDAEQGLAYLVRATTVLDLYANLSQISARINVTSLLLWRAAMPSISMPPLETDGVAAVVNRLESEHQQGNLSDRRLWMAIMGLGLMTSNSDEEAVGLMILDRATAADPLLAKEHETALAFGRIALMMNDAVNYVDDSDPDGALLRYVAAASLAASHGWESQLSDLLRRSIDMIAGTSPETWFQVGPTLARMSPDIEKLLGAEGQHVLAELWRRAMFAVLPSGTIVVYFFHRLVKGLRYASTLSRFDLPEPDNDEQEQAEQVALLGDIPGWAAVGSPLEHPTIVGDIIKANTVGPPNVVAAREAARRLDALATSRIREGTSTRQPNIEDLESLQRSLPSDTVVLDWSIATSHNDDVLAVCLAIGQHWTDAVAFQIGEERIAEVGGDDGLLRLSAEAVFVASLRLALSDNDEDGRAAVAEGLELLAEPLRAMLATAWANGHRHLAVCGYRALHHLPWEILPSALGNDWTVSRIPHPAALRPLHRTAVANAKPLVVGCTFETSDDRGLDPLPEASTEATAVAATLGTTPLLGATRNDVLDAINLASVFHVATHGRFTPSTPILQALELAPDDELPWSINARDLVNLDLAHVEIVTMSACDSNVCRFDPLDNPSGLTPLLLAAGVRTVVGTQWKVRSDVSESFFTTFYTRHLGGLSARQAFAEAQAATRRSFPDRRHWAAFSYAGQV